MSWDGIRIDFGKINGWKFVSILLTVIIVIFMWTQKQTVTELNNNISQLDVYRKDSISFTKTINALGQEVSTQKSIVVTKTKETEKVLLENSQLTSLNQQLKFENISVAKGITATYESQESHKIYYDTLTQIQYVPVGTAFSTYDKWYNLSGKLGETGLIIDTLAFTNKFTVNLGYAKKDKPLRNLFKAKPLTAEILTDNPYTHTTTMKNIHLKPPKKKWYQTKGFAIVAGAVAGVFITSRL